jgi:hypothetical protein
MQLYCVACHVEIICALVSMKCIKLKQHKLCHKTTIYCILLGLWQQNCKSCHKTTLWPFEPRLKFENRMTKW